MANGVKAVRLLTSSATLSKPGDRRALHLKFMRRTAVNA